LPLTIRDLQNYKRQGRIITALTAWDALSGAWVDASGCDMALVGDSLAMVSLGHPTTLPVSLGAMVHHAQAVGRAIHRPLLVADLPFLSYQCGAEQAVAAAGRFLKETPCQAVKLEGAEPETMAVISRLVRTGPDCDGQILVTADLLGLTARQPPFVKPRLQGAEMFKQALQGWCHEQRHQGQTAHPPKEGNPPTPDC